MYEAENLMDMLVILSPFTSVTNIRIGSGRVYRATRKLSLRLLLESDFGVSGFVTTNRFGVRVKQLKFPYVERAENSGLGRSPNSEK